MAYRNDQESDEFRDRSRRAELVSIETSLASAGALEAQRKRLASELKDVEDVAARKRAKVPLPLLAKIRIASPCQARWDEMMGDGHVRHCSSCDKDVYDLSGLTTTEAESLLSREGPSACVRLHRRADGTVLTADCPTGAQRKRRNRWLAAGAAAAGGLLAAGAALAVGATISAEEPEHCTTLMMGAIAVMPELPEDVPMMGEPTMDDVPTARPSPVAPAPISGPTP